MLSDVPKPLLLISAINCDLTINHYYNQARSVFRSYLITTCVAFDKSLKLSKPQCLLLWDGDDNNTHNKSIMWSLPKDRVWFLWHQWVVYTLTSLPIEDLTQGLAFRSRLILKLKIRLIFDPKWPISISYPCIT